MDLADIEDVTNRWRPLSDDEEGVAVNLITDASEILRATYPGIDATITSGSLAASVVASVVAGMVKRAMMRNDGVKSESESVGPYSTNVSYDNSVGNLYLTASDRILILGYRPSGVSVRYGD